MEKNNEFKIDFIGVGAPKAGTTWLSQCLSEHPQICFSKEKEINFFNKEHFFYIKGWYKKRWTWHYPKGIGWYKFFFEHHKNGQIKGEFSVTYLYDADAPRLINKHFPGVKILIVLRNPVDLFYSHYIHARNQFQLPSIDEVLDSKLIDYGYYSKFIEAYMKQFPREQILILLYDDIIDDAGGFIKRVFKFLSVKDDFAPPSLYRVINPSAPKNTLESKFYFIIRNKILNTHIGEKLKKYQLIKSILVKIEIFMNKSLIIIGKRKKKYKEIPAPIKERLAEIYEPEIKKLEKLISRDLGHWINN